MYSLPFARLYRRWRPLAAPSLFFLGVIYYEELFLKLFCFGSLTLPGVFFTLLFSLPVALLLGLLCGGVSPRHGRNLLVICTLVLSLWLGAQTVYYRLFKVFLTIFSLTKMAMVAGAFGDMAVGEVLVNWFPVVMMAIPVGLAIWLRGRIISPEHRSAGLRLRWAALAALIQLLAIGLVMLCGGGVMSLRYIYFQTATPELETQYFGALTQTQLEIRRVLFGIDPDRGEDLPSDSSADASQDPDGTQEGGDSTAVFAPQGVHALPIDFDTIIAGETDEGLLQAHQWFSQRTPTPENQWTGYFKGKNLVWIVA